MRKKLIEVALPLEAINEASAREKSIRHGHPSTLHLWWARRPLAACRAVIFASLVDDPDDPDATPEFVEACRRLPRGKNAIANDTPRQRLFDFIELLVQWESTTNEDVLETARELIQLATGGNPPPLLDPFAGGGSIPLEAQRLGLEAHASDLNPVAVMINKAQIEIPPRFANMPPVNPRDRQGTAQGMGWRGAQGLAADVRYYGEWMRDRAWERIGHLYPTGPNDETVIAWLWARTVKCPNPACGAVMPLITSFELSQKKSNHVWLEPQIDKKNKRIHFQICEGDGTVPNPPKVGHGAKFQCLVCGEIAPDEHIKSEAMAGRMGAQLIAIVTRGQYGRNFYPPIPEHENIAKQIKPDWEPSGELVNDPRALTVILYGLDEFSDLFTSRQIVTLTHLIELIREVQAQIKLDLNNLSPTVLRSFDDGGDTYAKAVSVYLAFGISKLADNASSLCSWHSGAEHLKIRATFGRQALPMVWDYAEGNAFSDSTGNFYRQVELVAKVLELAIPAENYQGKSYQNDAVEMPPVHQVCISTDPPYYDNVPYAELSDYFYVWLRRALKDVYPDIFSTMLVPKEKELVADHQRLGGRDAANAHFENGLRKVFSRAYQIIDPNYPLTIYYAFKQNEAISDSLAERTTASTGWETMLEGLIKSNFLIDGTWPIRTELNNRMRGLGSNALASSIVLVCRPRPSDAPVISRREFVNALRREMPAALHELQSGNIAPVDLAQASIGPGMAVYSRYRKVLEANGEALTVRTALQLINQELDAYLAEQEGDVDADTRFAINWFEQYGLREGEFGVADVLARAKNTSVEGVANAGVVMAGGGKVRLLPWQELDAAWDPSTDRRATVWEGTHHLIERLNTYGEDGAARLLMKMSSDLAAESRALAYRLYSVCERKNWADIARDYNALVVSWPRLQELANELRQNEPPEQLDLF